MWGKRIVGRGTCPLRAPPVGLVGGPAGARPRDPNRPPPDKQPCSQYRCGEASPPWALRVTEEPVPGQGDRTGVVTAFVSEAPLHDQDGSAPCESGLWPLGQRF